MATLFALSNGDISTIGSLNSAAAIIGNAGVIGSVLSASRALAATTSYTINTPVHGIALCLSSVGSIAPSDTITIRLSTTSYTYNATGLSPGVYSNSYFAAQPQAMVGWVLFKLPAPVSYSAAPPLSVFGPSSVRLMGSAATTPASILVYGTYNNISQPADIVYLTKSFTTGLAVENKNFTGFLSSANVYICDGVTSNNTFNISQAAANNIHIGRGGIFTGVAVVTGLNMQNQFIHVLDGAILSANYATPTITARIKAVSSAVVDLNNVVGFGMKSSGVYNTGVLNPAYDYLHDITTGYAKFNNTTFWSGISANNLRTNVSNLSVYNSTFNEKYTHTNTTVVTSNNSFSIGTNTFNNVLLSGITINESLFLEGKFNNFKLDSSNIVKKLEITSSTFDSSLLNNVSFTGNSSLDTVLLSANSSLPTFTNILIPNRRTGITKYDSVNLSVDGLSCLSSYYYSISAGNLTGDLSNLYIKDSTYGAYDITFGSSAAPLTINGLTAIRTNAESLTSNTTIGTSIRTNTSPFVNGSSLLLSSISARITAPLPKIITNNDDFTLETWYNPISSVLTNAQSLITIWDPLSTTNSALGCVFGLYISTGGLLTLRKGSDTNGTPADLVAVAAADKLANQKWYHIALTKSANNYKLYFDGRLVLSDTDTAEFFQPKNTGSYNLYVGARPFTRTTFGESLCGYVAGARLSYSNLYKDEFDVSSEPLKTTAGTLFNLTTSFSGEYSVMPRVFLDIENNKSYYPVTLNGLKFIANNTLSSSLIDISNSSYELFSVNDSDLSTYGKPLVTNNDQDYIMGSYVFNKCYFLNEVVNSDTIKGYQPFTYRETGFALQNVNGDLNNHYKWTQGGKVSLDSSTAYLDLPTEKLESISDSYPLKSNLKLIPVSPSSITKGITLTYKTPVSYVSGGALKIDKNALLGIDEDVVLGSLPPTNDTWSTITLSLSDYNNPFWKQKAYLESYVELTGSNNQLHIAKWQVSTI